MKTEKREYKGEWWTCPADSQDGDMTIIVTGRSDIEKFRKNPRFKYRLTITFPYGPASDGMPDSETSVVLADITDRLAFMFDADPVAVMTGIYTGANERNWVFYTLSLPIFQRKMNEALADLPLLPLKIEAENDPDWEEYSEMRDATKLESSAE